MNRVEFQSRILLAAGAFERAWGRLTGDETQRARGERDRYLARLLQASSHAMSPATITSRRSPNGKLTGGSGK